MFREIRRSERITDRYENRRSLDGFDPDARVKPRKERPIYDKLIGFDPDARVTATELWGI